MLALLCSLFISLNFSKLSFFTIEYLDDIHSGNVLLHERVQIGYCRSNLIERYFYFLLEGRR